MLLGLLFAFPLNVSAEDGSSEVLDVRDFTYECYFGDDNENNEKLPLTVTDATYGSDGIWMRKYTCSASATVKTLILTDLTELIADHEYNLEFYYATDYIDTTLLSVQLRFYTSTGDLIKTQVLDQFTPNKSGNQLYSGNFKPDVSDINQSYNIKLCIAFLTPNSNTVSWRVSHEIILTDKDDDSGWFQKILNKINDVWESIKSLPEKIGSYISSLGDRIDEAFQVVGDGIIDGIREALQWAFVPSEEYLDGYADIWQSWFESHFGVFSQVTNFLVDMIDEFKDLFTGNYSFVFPEVSVPIMDKNIVLIQEQTVDISQWLEAGSFGARLYEIYTTCVWAIIIYCVMKYALVVQDIIFTGNRLVLNSV